MQKLIKIFSSGFVISFLGTLPLGTLNITAFQIAASQNVNQALLFTFATILVELIVVRITLSGVNKIDFKSKWALYIMPLAIFLLFYLGFSNFVSANSNNGLETSANLFPLIKSSFLLGILLGVLNPSHIPFWMGWNSVLSSRKTLDNTKGMYATYITAIGLGSLAGLAIFIFAGKYIFQNYQQYSFIIAFIMGCVYFSFAMYLLFKFYKNHLKLLIQ